MTNHSQGECGGNEPTESGNGPADRRVASQSVATRWVAVLTALVVLVVGVISVARWTLIPLSIDSRVASTSWVDSTTGHLRTIELVNGSSLVVGRELLEQAGGPDALEHVTIRKARWDRTLHVGDSAISLPVTTDMWRTVTAILFLVGFGWWLRWRIWRGDSTQDPATIP